MNDTGDHGDHQEANELEMVEFCIDSYRFGVRKDHVVDADGWHPNYLRPARCTNKGVLGTMLYRGESIYVIDLRQMLFVDQENEPAEASFYTVIKYEGMLLTILHDGLLGLCHAPSQHYRSCQSLYVLGRKCLKGIYVLDDHLLFKLSLMALSEMLRLEGDAFQQEASSYFATELLSEES